MKEIKEKIDKILKTYLARTIAVNQFGLREKLSELFEKEKERAIQIDRGIQGQEWYNLLKKEKEKWVEETEEDKLTAKRCLNFKGFHCDNKNCLNEMCPLVCQKK